MRGSVGCGGNGDIPGGSFYIKVKKMCCCEGLFTDCIYGSGQGGWVGLGVGSLFFIFYGSRRG